MAAINLNVNHILNCSFQLYGLKKQTKAVGLGCAGWRGTYISQPDVSNVSWLYPSQQGEEMSRAKSPHSAAECPS